MAPAHKHPSRLPFRVAVCWLLAFLAAVLLPASPARGGADWLIGGNWVELGKPCTVRQADGREQNVGMEFLEGVAILHPPYGFGLDIPASRVPARYEERGDAVRVRLEFANGEAGDMVLHRVGADRLRDGAGYLYRRRPGMVS